MSWEAMGVIVGAIAFLGTAGGWIWKLRGELSKVQAAPPPAIIDAATPEDVENLRKDLSAMRKLIYEQEEKYIKPLYDWHNVADPDDPTQKIWWNSVAQRKQAATQERLTGELVDRTSELGRTMSRLIEVVEKLARRE